MKDPDFKQGDIVMNIYAGESNPQRYLLYIGKCTIRQGRYTSKGYKCIAHDGDKVELFRDGPFGDTLVKIGHMDEYDAFKNALSKLRELEKRFEE